VPFSFCILTLVSEPTFFTRVATKMAGNQTFLLSVTAAIQKTVAFIPPFL